MTLHESLNELDDSRIKQIRPLISPQILMQDLPLTPDITCTVKQTRQQIQSILTNQSNKLLVIIGPCSIHDPLFAIEYANRLVNLKEEFKELMIVMRVYFEKPRTIVGWKGLINDPELNGSFKINNGLRLARQVMIDINALCIVHCALEWLVAANSWVKIHILFIVYLIDMSSLNHHLLVYLASISTLFSSHTDTITPQFLGDLVSWAAIGARTTESQIHRELASGLSVPVGFKNGTDGNTKIVVDAIKSASSEHHFLSVTKQGQSAIIATDGNPYCHCILRGSTKGTNYDQESVRKMSLDLKNAGLRQGLMIDCSHGNSLKNHENQIKVVDEVCKQLETDSDNCLIGVMIESHLVQGKQSIPNDLSRLVYGQSVTDACIGWEDSVKVMEKLNAAVKIRNSKNAKQYDVGGM